MPENVPQDVTEGARPPEPRPTLGRVVIYYAHRNDGIVPEMAHVCHVWSGDCVNLDVVSGNGEHYVATSVTKGGPGQPGTWAYPVRV